MVSGYRKTQSDIVVCFQIKDVLTVNGKIYRDASSSLENALIVGLPVGSHIPFRII
ncbi:AvrPphF family type III effector [Escherichia coli]